METKQNMGSLIQNNEWINGNCPWPLSIFLDKTDWQDEISPDHEPIFLIFDHWLAVIIDPVLRQEHKMSYKIVLIRFTGINLIQKVWGLIITMK